MQVVKSRSQGGNKKFEFVISILINKAIRVDEDRDPESSPAENKLELDKITYLYGYDSHDDLLSSLSTAS